MDESARDRYLDAATRAAGLNAEEEVHLRQSLEQLLPEAIRDEEIEACAARLKAAPLRRWPRWIGIALVLLVSLPILLRIAGPARQGLGFIHSGLPAADPSSPPAWSGQLTAAERLYCFGDPGASDDLARWQPLWDLHPTDPALVIHRILVENDETGTANPDWVETGRRIDPGNGWFALQAAAGGSKSVAEFGEIKAADRDAGIAKPVTVHDETELARRIAWFHEAAESEFITSRQPERLARILEILGPANTWLDRTREMVMGVAMKSDALDWLNFSTLIAAEADRCSTAGDAAGFRRLVASWERTLTHMLRCEGGMISGLVARVFATSTLPALRDAAEELKIDAELWRGREEAMRMAMKRTKLRKGDESQTKLLRDHGSLFASLMLPMSFKMVEQAPPLTAADLEPGCRGDQAFLARGLTLPTWLLLGAGMLVGISGSRTRRRLARSCVPWTRADLVWVLAAGVLLPSAGWWVLRSATPWGRLDVSPWRSLFIGPAGQFLGLWLLLLVTPLAVAGWRLGKSAAVLGFAPQGKLRMAVIVLPWLSLGLVAAALPLHGMTIPMAGGAVLALVASLVLSCFLGRSGSAGREGGKWRRAVLMKTTAPAGWCGLACIALLVPLLEIEERKWIPKDRIIGLTPYGPAYEAELAKAIARETAELLGLPSPAERPAGHGP